MSSIGHSSGLHSRRGLERTLLFVFHPRPCSYYGPDAKEWRPARWLAPSSAASTNSKALKVLEDHFLSFGYGPRVCLGRDLAFLEARVFIVLVLLAFELEPAMGVKKVCRSTSTGCTSIYFCS